MNKNSEGAVHITDNLRFAAALTVAGFRIHNADLVDDHINKREIIVCELDAEKHGVKAETLKHLFSDKEHIRARTIANRVDEIIRIRSITPDEYVILAFDSASAALQNRSQISYAVQKRRPLIAKSIGDGRSIIYREGTSPDDLAAILREANR